MVVFAVCERHSEAARCVQRGDIFCWIAEASPTVGRAEVSGRARAGPQAKTNRQRVSGPPAIGDLMIDPSSTWLTAAEAARYLKIEPRTLLMWARQGKVRGYVLSGTRRQTWRFLHADLDAMLLGPSVALNEKGRTQ